MVDQSKRGERLTITSVSNDRVKEIRALEMRKTRRATGMFVAEGTSILMSARDNGFVPDTLVAGPGAQNQPTAQDLIAWVLSRGGDVLDVAPLVLEKLAAKDNPQTLLGVFMQRWAKAPVPSTVAPEATWLVLEAIRDPGNLGTIVRTADALGVAGVILAGTCCDPWSRECVRASMGSIFAMPIARMESEDLLSYIAAWPGDSLATDLNATEDFRTTRPQGPTLLVMGSEGPGLMADTANACRRRLKIPMTPRIDSLNLAVATALVLYQIQGPRLKI
jgi:RNA methyltransferase, TrmH family